MKTTIFLTGDVNLRGVTDPAMPFALVADRLGRSDLLFGNLEGCLYDSEVELAYKLGWRHAGIAPAPVLKHAGFDAVGCANNVTFGAEAIRSTLALLDEMDIAHTGAGIDRDSAREPAVIERNGVTFGFLQYSSVFWPIGHEATDDSPGINVVKAHTAYQPNARIAEMPGGPPVVTTWPEPDHLARFEDDVRQLRPRVDVLVVSCHWGISGSHETAQYQVTLGRAAVDAGADLVIGHGPHEVQSIEVYKDKVVFHSLGNFTFGPGLVSGDWVGLLVKVELDGTDVVSVACLPVAPNADHQTMIRSIDEEPETVAKLAELSGALGTELKLTEHEIVVWQAS